MMSCHTVGRIGFAFSLVEPEELAFMVDVHMLLGKELDASYNSKKVDNALTTEEEMKDTFDVDLETSANVITSSSFSSSSNNNNGQSNEQCSYTLETMSPDSVQTGWSLTDIFAVPMTREK